MYVWLVDHVFVCSCCFTWSLTTWQISWPPLTSSACSQSSWKKPTSTSSLNLRNSASTLLPHCYVRLSSVCCLLVVKCVTALNRRASGRHRPLLSSRSHPFFFSSRDVRLLILEHSRWSMVDKYQALTAGLTTEELTEFSRSFRAELFAEGLVQGNFSSAVSGQQTAHRQAYWLTIILAD